MGPDTVCKTVHQYNQVPISKEDMAKLLEIGADYQKVKNYIYTRYGGRGSLAKIYPGYTVQNEMTQSGLRVQWNMPSVYFYLAIFDALGEIRSQWTRTKTKVIKLAGENGNLSPEEMHYLRFLAKVNNAFEAVINDQPVKLDAKLQRQYDSLAKAVDVPKLHHYLARQVRRHHKKLYTDRADGFSLSAKAYRYENHGIAIATKEKRKRIFVPLTDNNQYHVQIYLKLYPQENRLEIKVPIQVAVRSHEDYSHVIGVVLGQYPMLTTDEGNQYGMAFGKMQLEYAKWLRSQTGSYNSNRQDNPGRKKYHAKKNRYEEQLHSYINQELNRFLQTEKPQVIYLPKLPRPLAGTSNVRANPMAALWQRGYIRKRLMQKCQEQSVKLVEVFGKNISKECSQCGAFGCTEKGIFFCADCGNQMEDRVNGAKNARKRGEGETQSRKEKETSGG